MVRTNLPILSLSAALLAGSGCISPQSDAVTSLVAASAASTVANSAGGDVYLAIDTSWQLSPTTYTRQGICTVDTGNPTRQTTCTIRVPEGQLFYSNTKFVFGTGNPSYCARVQFFPAVYQASNRVGYVTAYDGTPYDCSSSSLVDIPGFPGVPAKGSDIHCFFGPARAIYQQWPAPLGTYFNTTIGGANESSIQVASSNELGASNTFPVMMDGNYFWNLAVANKIDNTAANVVSPLGADIYLANTMRPYRARCLDSHEQVLAEVIVNIADKDLSTGEDPNVPADDQFYDFFQTL